MSSSVNLTLYIRFYSVQIFFLLFCIMKIGLIFSLFDIGIEEGGVRERQGNRRYKSNLGMIGHEKYSSE